jgi:hypothetical protein
MNVRKLRKYLLVEVILPIPGWQVVFPDQFRDLFQGKQWVQIKE